jgi:Ran GTPase-activating protein (RanGAP) involved in mRNA processing and transport
MEPIAHAATGIAAPPALLELALEPLVLQLVFVQLPLDELALAACVCKPWRDAAAHPDVLADLSFKSCTARVTEAVVRRLCARAGAALRTLSLRIEIWAEGICCTPSGAVRAVVAGGCINLRGASLLIAATAATQLSSAEALQLAAACPRLEWTHAYVLCGDFAAAGAVAAALPGPLALEITHEESESATPDAVALLRGSPSVSDLFVNGTASGGISAALADVVRDTPSLVTLDIRLGRCGDAGAAQLATALQSDARLTTLGLAGNEIGAAGAAALAGALRVNRALAGLVLSGNNIGAAGAVALGDALGDAPGSNTTLTGLDLSGNRIGAAGAAAIAAALRRGAPLQHLDLRQSYIGEDGITALAGALRSNATLNYLACGDSDQFGDSGAAALAGALQHNATLRALHVRDCGIPARGSHALLCALADSMGCALTELDISDGAVIAPDGAAALGRLLQRSTALRTLHLSEHICDAGWAHLAQALPDNTTLHALDVDGGSVHAFALCCTALARNTGLRELLWDCVDDNDDVVATGLALATLLQGNSSLVQLQLAAGLPPGVWAEAAAGLRANSTLSTLNLSELDDAGAAAIADALTGNVGVTELGLRDCHLGDAGAAALAAALPRLHALLALDVSQPDNADDAIGPAGVAAFAAALRTGCSLRMLSLSGNKVGDAGAEVLATLLRDAPAALPLQELHVHECAISEASLTLLLEVAEQRGVQLLSMWQQ